MRTECGFFTYKLVRGRRTFYIIKLIHNLNITYGSLKFGSIKPLAQAYFCVRQLSQNLTRKRILINEHTFSITQLLHVKYQ